MNDHKDVPNILPRWKHHAVVWGAVIVGALTVVFALWVIEFSGRATHDGEALLRRLGYHEIEMGERAWVDCAKGDTRSSAFWAISPEGDRVNGVVCCSTLGACYVRH